MNNDKSIDRILFCCVQLTAMDSMISSIKRMFSLTFIHMQPHHVLSSEPLWVHIAQDIYLVHGSVESIWLAYRQWMLITFSTYVPRWQSTNGFFGLSSKYPKPFFYHSISRFKFSHWFRSMEHVLFGFLFVQGNANTIRGFILVFDAKRQLELSMFQKKM